MVQIPRAETRDTIIQLWSKGHGQSARGLGLEDENREQVGENQASNFLPLHCIDYQIPCPSQLLGTTLLTDTTLLRTYPLTYGVPVRERYGSTLLPATREQHDQNCTQSH
jgi:hypothetical protein